MPQYIEKEAAEHGLSPQDIIAELEVLRAPSGSAGKKTLNALMHEVKKLRYEKIAQKRTTVHIYFSEICSFDLIEFCIGSNRPVYSYRNATRAKTEEARQNSTTSYYQTSQDVTDRMVVGAP